MTARWIIVGPSELLWSNDLGWVDRLIDADIFTDEDKAEYALPMYGYWKEIENA